MDQRQVVIFICEHGAAKSIVAAAYFNHLAHETGLPWQAIARGTSPTEELSSQAVEGLSKDGLPPAESKPQKLSPADVQSAQRVVTFCELPVEYQGQVIIEHWDDIPPVSENYETARDAILRHIHDFLSQIR